VRALRPIRSCNRASRPARSPVRFCTIRREIKMNQIIYIVGAVVIVLALLSFVGLR